MTGCVLIDDQISSQIHLLGDVNCGNYSCSVDIFIDNGNVELGGRVKGSYLKGYRFQLAKNGSWKLLFHNQVLKNRSIPNFDGNKWHHLTLNFKENEIKAFVDGNQITNLLGKPNKGY